MILASYGNVALMLAASNSVLYEAHHHFGLARASYNQSQFLLTGWNSTLHIFISIYIYLFNSSFHKLQSLVQTCSTFKMFKKIDGFNYFTRDFIISALIEFSFIAKLNI